MKRRALARAIESLVRCRNRQQSLPPGPQRIPMTGGDGVGHQLVPLPYDEAFPYHFRGLESGLILFSTMTVGGTVYVANTAFPLPIYLGKDLAAYAGVGSSLPGYAETRWLFWGDRQGDPPSACLPWPTSFPLGADNEYTSEGFTAASVLESSRGHVIDPGWYTGKPRQAAQAKLQAGKSIDRLAPASWNTGVRLFISCNLGISDGMFHDGNYHYWLIRIDSAGCRAVQLDIPTLYAGVECLRTWLQDGLITDDAEKVRIESYLLSYLEPVAGSEIEVLSAGDVEDVYSDGKAPLEHGWHYSRQITTKTEASIVVTHQAPASTPTTYYHRNYLWSVVFTVSASNVEATLTLEEEEDFYSLPGSDYLFLDDPLTGLPCWWNARSSGYVPKGNHTPYYCFYTKDDELEICRYSYEVIAGQKGIGANGWGPGSGCTPGKYREDGYRNPTLTSFTFEVNYLADIETGSAGPGDYVQWFQKEWGWDEVGGERLCSCYKETTGSGCGFSLPEICGGLSGYSYLPYRNAKQCRGGDTNGLYWNECYEAYITTGTAWAQQEQILLYGATTKKYVFIPSTDAEAIYAIERIEYDAGSSKSFDNGGNGNALLTSRFVNVQPAPGHTGHTVGPWHHAITIGPGNNGTSCAPNAFYHTGNWVHTSENGAGSDMKANLVTAHSRVQMDESDDSVWDLHPSIYDPCLDFSMPVQVSYVHGDTAYKESPGSFVVATDDGMVPNYGADEDELRTRQKRFIGGA